MVWGGGGKQYVKNVCMYAALFCLYSAIATQTARPNCAPQGSVPLGVAIYVPC